MYEKLEQCPVCQYTSHDNYLICDDHSVSKESFALVRCPRCHTIYTNPRPSKEHIHTYYQSNDYISHTSQANNLINFAYKLARTYTLRWKFNIIRQLHSKPGRLLDFGAGTGDFQHYVQRKKWSTIGVEPNDSARSIAISKNIQVFPQLSKDNKSEYDIITAWHVLEHVHELKDTIRKLRKRLAPHGHLLIAVPNPHSYDAQHYESFWAGYDVPRHLYHFPPESIQNIAQRTKLQLKRTLPMKLDAYYVSILSEKYRQSSTAILSGLQTGWRSNQHAAKSQQYSSLIYVLTK